MLMRILMAAGFCALAGTASAEQGLGCENPLTLGGAQAGETPDLVHELVAHPGAFGGQMACVLERRGDAVEQYWVEFLPDNGATVEHVTYKTGTIQYFLKFKDDEGGPVEVAACAMRQGGGLACRVDMAAGKGLYLARFFAPDLSFTGIRVMAFPAKGVVNGTLWEMVGAQVEAGEMGMEMELKLTASGWSHQLKQEAESRPGNPVWGFSGDPAGAFMEAVYNERQPVVLETRVTNEVGDQIVTTTATHDITEGNLAYLIDKLAKVEQLMVAGFENSRTIRF